MLRTNRPPEVGPDGLALDELFAILGNEIRLNIVRALWQTAIAADAPATLSFSELRDRVAVTDNGRFNYHLSKLVPHIVRNTDGGYRLSRSNERLVGILVAVTERDRLDLGVTLERHCPWCEVPMRVAYENHWFRITCTECNGVFGCEPPERTARFRGDTHEVASTAGRSRCVLDLVYTTHGVCRACGERIDTSVMVCEDHDARGERTCDTCGTPFAVWVETRCDACGFTMRLPAELFALGLTPVIGFLDDDGIDVLNRSFDRVVDLLRSRCNASVAETRRRVSVTVEGKATSLTVSLDDELNVVRLDRRSLAGREPTGRRSSTSDE